MIINFACSCSNWEKPELKGSSVIDPLATSFQIRMVYTDSLKINSILTAPKHEDYKNLFFKYSIFPDGLKLVFYDSFGCPSTVEADYGTIYKDTSILLEETKYKFTNTIKAESGLQVDFQDL